MSDSTITLALLGALHGINPGMGWLFAVALGFQEQSARAVWRALPPLAAGHALAVLAALLVFAVAGEVLPPQAVKAAVGVLLIALGVVRFTRHRHGRAGRMRAGARELVAWSFLMASGHGAGLMVLPAVTPAHAGHQLLQASAIAVQPDWRAALIHTTAYLLVTGLIAGLVYQKLGLRRLTSLWINVDAAWAAALVLVGVVALL